MKALMEKLLYRMVAADSGLKQLGWWLWFILFSVISFIPVYYIDGSFRLPQYVLSSFYYLVWVTGVFAFFVAVGRKYVAWYSAGLIWFMHWYPHHLGLLGKIHHPLLLLYAALLLVAVLGLRFLEKNGRMPAKAELRTAVYDFAGSVKQGSCRNKTVLLMFLLYFVFICSVTVFHREYNATHFASTGVYYDGFYEANFRQYTLHSDSVFIIQAASYMAGAEIEHIKYNTALPRQMIGYLGKLVYPYWGFYEQVNAYPGYEYGVFSGFYRGQLFLDMLFWFLPAVMLFLMVRRWYRNDFLAFIAGFLFVSSHMYLNIQGYVENYLLGRFVFFAFCYLLTHRLVDTDRLSFKNMSLATAVLGVSSLSWSFPLPDLFFLFFFRLRRLKIWQFAFCAVLGCLPALVVQKGIVDVFKISADQQLTGFYKIFIDAFLYNYIHFSHWSVPYLHMSKFMGRMMEDIFCYYLILLPVLACIGFYSHVKMETSCKQTLFYVGIFMAQFAKYFSMNMWSDDHNFGYIAYAIYPLAAIGLNTLANNLLSAFSTKTIQRAVVLVVLIFALTLNFSDRLTGRKTFYALLDYGPNVVTLKHWGNAVADPFYITKKLEGAKKRGKLYKDWWEKR